MDNDGQQCKVYQKTLQNNTHGLPIHNDTHTYMCIYLPDPRDGNFRLQQVSTIDMIVRVESKSTLMKIPKWSELRRSKMAGHWSYQSLIWAMWCALVMI